MRDDLVRRRLVGCERQDPDEQLEPDAVLPASRHVLHVALGCGGVAVPVVDDDLVVANPDDAAVTCDQAVVEEHRPRRVQACVPVDEVGQHSVAVVRVEAVGEQVRVGQPLLLGVAHQLRDLRAHVERRALVVELVDVDDERQPLYELLEVESGHPVSDRSDRPRNEGISPARPRAAGRAWRAGAPAAPSRLRARA